MSIDIVIDIVVDIYVEVIGIDKVKVYALLIYYR
jgi:hypothetical protein